MNEATKKAKKELLSMSMTELKNMQKIIDERLRFETSMGNKNTYDHLNQIKGAIQRCIIFKSNHH
ncbi:MAG TPA: hypothetical protein VMY59_06465 [Candidatus Thermoplasmatota archaeon]|nr:hypothetical protein [Candidatus Thermoplasmatota archaeon]